MPIIASVIVEDRVQRDGRRSVRERHTDHAGVAHERAYLAEAGQDVQGGLATMAALIEADLRSREVAANLVRAMDQDMPTLTHSTIAQFRQALRQAYLTVQGWDAVRLGRFIQSLNLSDAQLMALFGVNAAQLVTLKARLARQAQRYSDAMGEAGE